MIARIEGACAQSAQEVACGHDFPPLIRKPSATPTPSVGTHWSTSRADPGATMCRAGAAAENAATTFAAGRRRAG